MEIEPYKIDQKAVDDRKNLKPFGKMQNEKSETYSQIIDNPAKFIRTDLLEVEEEQEDAGIYVYKPTYLKKEEMKVADSNVYVPPSLLSTPTSIKVSNLPYEIDKKMLEKLIIDNADLHPTSTYVVLDKDSHESRGYAYVAFVSLEQAKEAVKKMDGFRIDEFILGAELAKSRF